MKCERILSAKIDISKKVKQQLKYILVKVDTTAAPVLYIVGQ